MMSASRSMPIAPCICLMVASLKTAWLLKHNCHLMFGGFWHDVRYGARMLLKSPIYTALAISIGANTAVFSAVNTLLLRPLPLKDLDRLVFSVALREGFDPFGSSLLEFEAYRQRNHSFESTGVAMQRSFSLIGRGEPERIRGALIMADYLTTLGVKPVLGRSLTLEEDQPGGCGIKIDSAPVGAGISAGPSRLERQIDLAAASTAG